MTPQFSNHYHPLIMPPTADLAIRLRGHELLKLALTHLFSTEDPMVLADARAHFGANAVTGGTTEWTGQYGATVVTFAWDWVQEANGTVSVLPVAPPRTNVQLIDAQGYDLAVTAAVSCMWEAIGKLNWQADVVRDSRAQRLLADCSHARH